MKTNSGIRIFLTLILIGVLLAVGIGNYFSVGEEEKTSSEINDQVQSVSVDTVEIEKDTVIVAENYYEEEKTTVSNEIKNTNSYIGMSQSDLKEQIELINQNPDSKLLDQGFISLELMQFSKEKVLLKYTFFSESMEDVYRISEQDGRLVATSPDGLVVYATSDIMTDSLPKAIVEQIRNGFFYMTKEQVYDFIESYSS